MSERAEPELKTVGRTMRHGETVEAGDVRVTWRGRRLYFTVPKDVVVGYPVVMPPEPVDERNLDDEEDRR